MDALSLFGGGDTARFTLVLDLRSLLSPSELADFSARAEAEHTTEARLMRRMLADDLRGEPPGASDGAPAAWTKRRSSRDRTTAPAMERGTKA